MKIVLFTASFVFLVLFLCQITPAGVPVVSNIEVTDVTPKSFSVSWLTSEPSIADLIIYQSDCIVPVSGPQKIWTGNDTTGNLKVTVLGLLAESEYCFQTVTTSKSTTETAVSPSAPLPVQTEKQVSRIMMVDGKFLPFANDLVRVPPVYLPSPAGTQDGILVFLSTPDVDGRKSLSLLLAGTSPSYFNLNNLFDPVTCENKNLSGGERIRIEEFHGRSGCAIERFRKAPADNEITAARDLSPCFGPQDIDCNDTVDILDILRAVKWFGSSIGDACFNSDIDLIQDLDQTINILDILNVVGSFGATP